MKRNKHWLIAIALLLCCIAANAKTVQINGIWYYLVNETKQAHVTSATEQSKPKYTGSVAIPSTVLYEGTTYSVTEIGSYAFFSCTKLTSVTIPESVTKIGVGAFEECRSLPSVTLPSNLKSIEKYAFAGCSKLTSMTIPATVTWIGEGSFWDCVGLKELVIKDGSEVLCLGANFSSLISEGMFNDCPLEKLYLGRDLSYSESESYGYSPFYDQTKLTSVTFGNQVTVIGDNLLSNCNNITSVQIPQSVESIGQSAFGDCANLSTITISGDSKLASIGNSAFSGCGKFSSFALPENVTEIGNSVFEGCRSLVSIDISENSKLASIGDNAFFGCGKLAFVVIPAGVTSVGSSAFEGCSGLDSIQIASLEAWCNIDFESPYANPLYHAKKLYLNNQPIQALVIPNTITSIKNYSFYNFSDGLTTVTLPENVVSIGDGAFFNCNSLTAINIPNSVASIGRSAFENCTGELLVDCNIDPASSASDGAFYKGGFSKVTISDKVDSIGSYAFFNCANLVSVSIPESVDTIGSKAFEGCTGDLLVNCVLPSVSSAKNSGFYGSNFSKIIVGDKVEKIGDYSFSGLTKLASVTIPENVKSIGKNVFENCTGEVLVNCNIPSASSTSEGAFYKSNFSKVVLGDKVTSVGDYAFFDCDTLASVVLPLALSSVGEDAFKGCKKLAGVHVKNIESWLTIKFANKDSRPNSQAKVKFYVNDVLLSKALISSVIDTIPDYAFYKCSFDSIVVPESVKSIGLSAFEDCTGALAVNCNIPSSGSLAVGGAFYKGAFGKVIVGENVDSIGSYAFSNCSKLTSVTIPQGVVSIGKSAFEGCTGELAVNCNIPSSLSSSEGGAFYKANFAKVIVGEDVDSIGSYAFSNCTKLTDLSLSSSIDSIGDNAFESCGSLSNIYIADVESWLAMKCGNKEARPNSQAKSKLYVEETLLSKVDLPTTVNSIPDYAFYNCAFDSIAIPESVVSIGKSAFEGCTGELVVNCDVPSSLSSSEGGAFYKSAFGKVIIGDKVNSIGSYAFSNCASLGSVDIISNVDTIGDKAFEKCGKLSNVYVKDLASWFSIKCGGKESRPNTINEKVNLYVDNTLLTDLDSSSVKGIIPDYAFSNCVQLSSIVVPVGLDSIGVEAFEGCTNLYRVFNYSTMPLSEGSEEFGYIAHNAKCVINMNKVVYEDDFWFQTSEDGIHYLVNYVGANRVPELPSSYNEEDYQIAGCAFFNCDSIVSVVIPECVNVIGDAAFSGCDSLASITLAENVATIGDGAFKGCVKLSNVYVNSLESWLGIEYGDKESHPNCNGKTNLFVADEMLKEVVIPAEITSVPEYAFYNCDSLTTIALHEGVEEIGAYAFAGCKGISSITCDALTPPVCVEKAFDGINKSIPVYVLTPAKDYKSAEGWKYFANIIGEDVDGVESVDANVESTVIYDLSGRRVENPTNGIYIINGKKVLIRN